MLQHPLNSLVITTIQEPAAPVSLDPQCSVGQVLPDLRDKERLEHRLLPLPPPVLQQVGWARSAAARAKLPVGLAGLSSMA